jgi:GxxExxY protein
MDKNYDLAGQVIGLAMVIHSTLGPGFVEAVYESAVCLDLGEAGILHSRQAPLEVRYRGHIIGDFFTDICIGRELIIELKSVQTLLPIHEVQLVNYLTATGIDEGLLLNFGSESLQFKKKFRKSQRP